MLVARCRDAESRRLRLSFRPAVRMKAESAILRLTMVEDWLRNLTFSANDESSVDDRPTEAFW